jgi:acetolactate synthase I/II/III large subunit
MAKKLSVDRRKFLKGAAAGAAGLVASASTLAAPQPNPSQSATASMMPKELDPSNVDVLTMERSGSDFMVDVLKSLGLEYIASNPGSSFRGLHESIINYGGNESPEFITCCHEESSVGLAHGYSKIEGKPMGVLVHSNVGLQHASMAIFNAYCDRAPVYIIAGNSIDATMRRPGVEWDHSAQDVAAMVRDFVKWDDLPISLPHFAESAVRAYKIAMTTPSMPVLVVADSDLQESPLAKDAAIHIPKLTLDSLPMGDSGSVGEAARLLVAAESPVIVADRAARTPAGMARLIELAEALQASVIDQGGRMNFPSRHPLNQSDRGRALIGDADVILGLELTDFWGITHSFRDQLHRTSKSTTKDGAKLISITAGDLYSKGNYQDLQRYPEVDLAIAADAETTLPSLIEAVKRLITDDRKRAYQDRGSKLADARQRALERARTDATYGWDSSPITIARLSAELWAAIKNEDWSLVSDVGFASRWPMRLWSFDKHSQFIGGAGGAGEGYCAPASAGAALANKKHGRLSVSINGDGDMMYAPGVLWTMAHHHIPLLKVMQNNRAYHQEYMHVQRMANRHERGITRADIGTTLKDPNIDFAKVAQGMGVYAEGPISDPKDLGPALKRAIEVVKRGEPALLDTVTEPR